MTVYVNTSNCGTCTASSTFVACNLTASNLQVDTVCNITVMIQIMECSTAITELYSADLSGEIYNELMYHGSNLLYTQITALAYASSDNDTMMTTADLS
jgi:hypothetical protein